ncbi:MAG: ATP-binding protein [Flavobacteriaceae bacterium]|nr:ATP-binding protein [Flavobacteriaceae bacterium]
MKAKKIVITGGPSTGKTSIINYLTQKNRFCFEEVSRSITLEARKEGIEQLFVTDPLLFSQKILEKRWEQYIKAQSISDHAFVFFDRGLPDVLAYMDFVEDPYPNEFEEVCKKAKYDMVFLIPPWAAIYTKDNERYESFEQAQQIHHHLQSCYQRFGYHPILLPEGSIAARTDFILSHIS